MKFALNEYHRDIPDEELTEDLIRVAKLLEKDSVTIDDYNHYGRFHATTLTGRFKSWFSCLEKAGLQTPRSKLIISDKELFEELENMWIKLRKQPSYSQMSDVSGFSVGAYINPNLPSHIESAAPLNRQISAHNMKLNPSPFEKIKCGKKTIELRLFDEKRRQVKIGDRIIFTNTVTGETLNTTVVKLHCFDSFEELYKSLPLLECGYTTENIENAKPSDMDKYYSIEEQNKYGVVGIELCHVK